MEVGKKKMDCERKVYENDDDARASAKAYARDMLIRPSLDTSNT
jgi:hypothetical protein